MPFRNQNRNASSEIFYNEKGSHAFPLDSTRFQSSAIVAKEEQARLIQSKQQIAAKRQSTLEFRQDREHMRWDTMKREEKREDAKLALAQSKTKVGQSSMAYNPITLAYHDSKNGESLQTRDLQSIHQTAVRSSKLYFKNNSFDAIKGSDITQETNDRFLEAGSDNASNGPLWAKRV
jgi:hypothetical protein